MSDLVAAIQMNSQDDVESNLRVAERLIGQAVGQGACVVVLPENFAFMGANESSKLVHAEAQGSGPIQEFLSEQARQRAVWLVAGSVPLKVPGDPDRVFAASLVFDDRGISVARYDKIHLFDVEIERTAKTDRYQESRHIAPGAWQPRTIDTPAGRLGLSICYDLRFPELFRDLVDQGARWFSVPAAFTAKTGEAHWEPLLRARAIENQCFVVAAGQFGTHADGRSTWGHSMVVDCWGEVTACQPTGESVVTARIDSARMDEIRARFPVHSHRRSRANRSS